MARSKNKRRQRTEYEKTERRYNSLMTGLALIFLSVTPLVFRLVELDFVAPDITNTTSADTDVISDVFTHVKMQFLYTLTVALSVIFCVKLIAVARGSSLTSPAPFTPASRTSEPERHMPWGFRLTRYDAALAVLCLALLLSCLTSQYAVVALNGFAYMLDGTVEHLCYCALFFFGFHVFARSELRRHFIIPLYIVGIANALISLLNFLGVRMIDTGVIKWIMGIPVAMRAVDARAFSSTFGNVNYLSGFGGVLFAIFLARLMFSEPSRRAGTVDRRILRTNAASLLMVAASFSIIVTSLSSSGFMTFVVMTPAVFVFAALGGVTKRKLLLAAASLAVCAAVFVPLAAANEAVLEETLGMFRSLGAITEQGSNAVSFTGAPSVFTQNAAPGTVPAEPDGVVAPVRLVFHAGQEDTAELMALSAETPETRSAETPDAQPYNADGLPLPPEFPAEGIAPGTGRLYIWQETLKLIARRPLLGYGMDTMSYAFPQNDLHKIAGLGSYSVFVTKPHNAYIGYAYGAGIPAALAFLALCVLGAAAFIRYFFAARAAKEPHDALIVCAMLGWAAYMVQAFVNDDLIATAPLWWALFGLGAGLIRQRETVK